MKKRRLKIFIWFLILVVITVVAFIWYRHHQRLVRLEQERLAASRLREERVLKVLEGWSNQQIGEELFRIGHPAATSFQNAVSASSSPKYLADFDFLADKPDVASLEGYLFPDTYRIYASSTAEEVIYRLLSNFDRKLSAEMRAEISRQGKTVYEIVTMASLIEKEAAIDQGKSNDDARIISGIFWNRIKNGQALQSCATLAYILGVNKQQYSEADTKIDSPYNTYLYRGLPYGPIANPGLAAIEAAIYPEYTEYNYFLTPAGSKQMIFSKTYDEHLHNKAKYLP
jgi:UPF0755 protein